MSGGLHVPLTILPGHDPDAVTQSPGRLDLQSPRARRQPDAGAGRPPPVAILVGVVASTGTQRIVTVLFADVVGSTAIGERIGPERSKFLFDEIVSLIGAEVRRFDGTVAQLLGDGLFAVFGAPVGHEDDAERAVRAAIAIQAAIAAYGEELRSGYGIELAVRVTLNTGPVVLTDEDDGSDRYNALGDTANVAARLQELAPDGGIVMGPETERQVQLCVELESLGEVELRGIEQPLRVARVTGVRGPAQVRAVVPLVGRSAELAVLNDACQAIADGSGAIVSITGESGIGKSRLVSEARRRFGDRIRFLEGRAGSYAESFPYWPVRDLLRDWLGIAADAPEARVRLELKTALGGLDDGVEFAYPFLARLLALPLEADADAALRELGREAVQQQTFAAMGAVVHRLADARPLCIVIDDLQWADSLTIELVEDLLALTDQAQLGIVLIYRAERDRPSWGLGERARAQFPHRYREIELRPLPTGASRELADALAESALPGAVADLLAERAGGNPFFLEEAIQDLIERGALRRREGAWELADGQVAVPTLVQGALQARLDRLPPRTREVVSVASAIGRGFGLPLLERLLPRDQVVPALSDLMRLDLIVEVSRRPAPEYRFRHGLVQEVAYNSLLEPARRSLHRRIGEALVALYGQSGDAVAGPIARHFAEADEPELAARYLLAAGDAARAVYADHEAIEHYRRARTFLRRLNDPARERETLFKIALVRHLAFDYARAGQAYDAAFDCSTEQRTERAPTPERLVLSLVRPDSYAPGDTYSTESAIVIEQLFRGLLRVDHDLNVVPELAQNMNVSADGLTYLFMLREDACWSDGHPLTAGDFVFAWRRLREEGHVTAFLLGDITSAEALDDWTLEVHLREPRNYFPYVLASHWAYPWPRHRADEIGAAWRRPESLVGNGPFVLAAVDDDGARLTANPHWLSAAGNVGEVEIAFRRVHDALDDWSEGRYDLQLAREAPAAATDTIAERAPTLSTEFLAFNVAHPAIADERVRRAIAHAIDSAALVADSPGVNHAAGTGGAIPPVMPGHSDGVGLAYGPARARELLAEAGFPDGNGLPELLVGARAWSQTTVLAEQLAAIGIRARFETRDKHCLVTDETHIWFAGWHADYPDPDGFYFGLLEQGLPLYRDDATDAALAQARASRNRDERLRLYREFERLWIGERAAIVPISYQRQIMLRRPNIHNVRPNPMGAFHLEQVVVEPAARRDQ
jgi:ABC-type transport system substrate-binding protein/class 3 adenylate cyclase